MKNGWSFEPLQCGLYLNTMFVTPVSLAANSVGSSANRYRVSIGMERCDGRRVNVVKVLGG